jgi:hypothetical protein
MNVYFTVDTESSMGGAWRHTEHRPLKADKHVFCRIGGQDYGIGLISRILSQCGFHATYFVEMLATLINGEDDTRGIFDYLLERAEDVQLHLHPTYHFYAKELVARAAGRPYHPPQPNDLLGALEEEQQMALLENATMLFQRFAGRRPAAFRAGCFAADRRTLRCLRKLGILLDTSYNPCCRSYSFTADDLEPNRVRKLEGVWELPVTVARTPLPEGYYGYKLADPVALSVTELRRMLEIGAARGQEHFVIVFHSFSLVKPKNEMYSVIKPNRIVIRRLEKLMEYLASRPDLYHVSTFGELAGNMTENAAAPVAELGFVAGGLRKFVQGLNSCYWV